MEKDWYLKLKLDFIKLVIVSFNFRRDLFYMAYTNPNILFDTNMDERFTHLIDSENLLCKYIVDFKKELDHLEKTGWSFFKNDLLDEFSYIQSIFHFEESYYNKLVDYLAMVDDYTIQGDEITKFLENNDEASSFCYRRIRENINDLKRLKQERRNDYFE